MGSFDNVGLSRFVHIRLLISLAVFVGSLALTTIAFTFGWETFVKNHIYNCTDDLPLDYLQPGQWVHDPVTVPHVSTRRSMSEPDAIKQGWSVFGLWALWSSFVLGSLVISFLFAGLWWSASKRTEEVHDCTNAA